MDADARFKAKLEARAAGKAPVFVDEPALAQGDDQAAIDERFRAKLERHGKPQPKPEAKPEGKREKAPAEGQGQPQPDTKSSKPEAKPEGEPRK